MDYRDAADQILRNYRRLRQSLVTLEKRKEKLIHMGAPSDQLTASLDLSGVRANNHREAEQLLFDMMGVVDAIAETSMELDIIDGILDDISKDKGCSWMGGFLHDWYIVRIPKKEIEAKYDR